MGKEAVNIGEARDALDTEACGQDRRRRVGVELVRRDPETVERGGRPDVVIELHLQCPLDNARLSHCADSHAVDADTRDAEAIRLQPILERFDLLRWRRKPGVQLVAVQVLMGARFFLDERIECRLVAEREAEVQGDERVLRMLTHIASRALGNRERNLSREAGRSVERALRPARDRGRRAAVAQGWCLRGSLSGHRTCDG